MSRLYACLLLIACAHPGHPTAPAQLPTGPLPRDVVPLRYSLTLAVDPHQTRFTGVEHIAVHVGSAVDSVWLHGRDLAVTSATYSSPGATDTIAEYEQLDPDGVARLRFPSPLQPGDGTLTLNWSAPFDEAADGLYKVHDGDADYGFTQFESQAARKMFPCFDEPGFKTPFDLTLIIPRGTQAVANTPIASATEDGPQRTIHFEPTAPLPTYLLSFAVGPLDIVEAPPIPPNEVRSTPLPLRGVAVHGKGPLLAYALQRTGAFVTILERYFGIAYPFPKLDVVAVPDFAAGAMENAGLITFKEFLLLVDEKTAPLWQKRAFASVTAHELSHQWFGDLVTMKWWDDTWLNEAFATWMSSRVIDAWDPAQKQSLDDLMSSQGAMSIDRLASSRAVHQPIRTNDDVENAFDGITYRKGAAVIGMFEHWVGEEKFRAGIHAYLEAHRSGNATEEEFLAAISQAAGIDVAGPFHTFLDQPGVPFLDVSVSCVGDVPSMEIAVSRYAPLGSSVNPNVQWQIPACFEYEVGGHPHEQCVLLTQAKQTQSMQTKTCPAWLLPNADARGYYSFALSPEWLAKLVAAAPQLNERERLAIAQAIVAASSAGRISFETALTDLVALAGNGEWRLATFVSNMLRFAREDMAPTELRPAVEKIARETASPPPRTAEPSQEEQLRLRTAAVQAIDVGRDPALRAAASQAAQRVLSGASEGSGMFADPSLVELAMDVAAEDGSAATLESMIAAAKAAQLPVRRGMFLSAVGSAVGGNTARAEQLTLEPWVRPTEVIQVLGPQAWRPETREETWKWFTAHYADLIHRMPEHARAPFPGLFAGFCSAERATELQAFFEPRMAEARGGPRELAKALEEVRLCAARVRVQQASFGKWLQAGGLWAHDSAHPNIWKPWLE